MSLVYIASVIASDDATVAFTTGIDATYNEYQFHCIDMHPITDSKQFGFQVNAHDGSSQLTGFNEVMTTTGAKMNHKEDDSVNGPLEQLGNVDQAQGTAYQSIFGHEIGNDADHSVSGILTLFAPASATYVKHFTSWGSGNQAADGTQNNFVSGYINTTNAITQISFNFSAGNIEFGTIHMYGVG